MSKIVIREVERPKPLFYSTKYLFIKPAIFLLIFALIHFIHKLIPSTVTLIIGANDESVFSHLKMAFWSCLFMILFEIVFFKKYLDNMTRFVASRLISAILAPWIEIVIWFIAPALLHNPLPLEYELVWAFFVVYLIGMFLAIIERDMIKIQFSTSALVVICALIGMTLFFFTVFTFEKPWIDIFALPEHS